MTRKQTKDLLEKLGNELKSEVEVVVSNIKEAKSVTTKINNLLIKANRYIEKLENSDNGVDALLNSASESKVKIEGLVSSASDQLELIKNHITECETQAASMSAAYDSFLLIKDKINDPSIGLEAILQESKRAKAQVLTAETQANNKLVSIDTALTTIQARIDTMETSYTEFLASKAKIDDPANGLEAILESSQELKDEIVGISKLSKTTQAAIAKFRDQAAEHGNEIKALKEESDSALEAIKLNEATSAETKDKISQIFELVSQSGHANYFDKRSKKLEITAWVWLGGGIVSLIGVVLLAHYWLAPLIPKDPSVQLESRMIGLLLLRAFIITPLAGFAIYCFTNHSRERRLGEQYAFKAISASTIEGSTELTKRTLGNIESNSYYEKLTDFVIKTMSNLHSEPSDLQKTQKLKINAGNKLVNIGAEMSESLEGIGKDIKDLADRMPDPKN